MQQAPQMWQRGAPADGTSQTKTPLKKSTIEPLSSKLLLEWYAIVIKPGPYTLKTACGNSAVLHLFDAAEAIGENANELSVLPSSVGIAPLEWVTRAGALGGKAVVGRQSVWLVVGRGILVDGHLTLTFLGFGLAIQHERLKLCPEVMGVLLRHDALYSALGIDVLDVALRPKSLDLRRCDFHGRPVLGVVGEARSFKKLLNRNGGDGDVVDVGLVSIAEAEDE